MIKVGKEIGERLNFMINDARFNNESILNIHSKGWIEGKNKCLNKLKLSELAECLFLGYEIEKTEEDYILNSYNSVTKVNVKNPYAQAYVSGYKEGVIMILNHKGMKIKGINE